MTVKARAPAPPRAAMPGSARKRRVKQVRSILLVVAVAALAGCATQLHNTTPLDVSMAHSGSALPRPQRVVVVGFAPGQEQVQLDQGVGLRLQRQFEAADVGVRQAAVADAVRAAIADTLVEDLARMSLPVERARPGDAMRPGDLVVAGEIVSIDEGNRTRRLTLGFGAGASQVQASIQVYLVGPDLTPRLLQAYSAKSDSGHMPGLALGGAGALAQGSAVPLAVSSALNVGGQVKRAGVAGEGQRLANRVAQELSRFFAAQGWIEPNRASPR